VGRTNVNDVRETAHTILCIMKIYGCVALLQPTLKLHHCRCIVRGIVESDVPDLGNKYASCERATFLTYLESDVRPVDDIQDVSSKRFTRVAAVHALKSEERSLEYKSIINSSNPVCSYRHV
jgi:hypothetical protein